MSSLFLVVVAVALAPLLSLLTRRVVPGVVFEIVLGLLLGPAVLGWARPSGFVAELADFGLALLMLLAGMEVSLASLRGAALRRAAGSWLASVGLAALVGVVVALVVSPAAAVVVAIALTTTALGTLVPIMRERGVAQAPLGRTVVALGTIGEFGPIVLIALLLGDQDELGVLAFLAAFAAIVGVGMWLVATWRLPRLRAAISSGLHGPAQLPVRVSILAVIFLVVVAEDLGIDPLLGAFCAGLIVRAGVGADTDPEHVRVFEGKIEAVGYGMLVPIFFVVAGMRLDLAAMVQTPLTFLLIPATLLALLVVRGLPSYLLHRRTLGRRDAGRAGLLAATALPLVVVVTDLGVASGALSAAVGAALVAGGLCSVLVLPILALPTRRVPPPHTHGHAPGVGKAQT